MIKNPLKTEYQQQSYFKKRQIWAFFKSMIVVITFLTGFHKQWHTNNIVIDITVVRIARTTLSICRKPYRAKYIF